MSQASVEARELAAAAYGALNAGDLDGFLAVATEDVEFTSLVAEAEGTVFRGHEGVRLWWRTVLGAFEDVRWDLLDVQAGAETSVLHVRVVGTLGGVPVEQLMWQAVRLRDRKACFWAFFRTEHEALEAARLAS
jgi:ketosteroid isomerase-like protein